MRPVPDQTTPLAKPDPGAPNRPGPVPAAPSPQRGRRYPMHSPAGNARARVLAPLLAVAVVLVGTAAAAPAAPPPEPVADEEGFHPAGALTLGSRFYEDETEFFGDVLVPLWAGDSTLLFINPRTSATDHDEEEVNLGLGIRHMTRGRRPFIVGANVYYDSRYTSNDNRFDQLGLGLEFLSKWFDARVNAYLPEDGKHLFHSFTLEESTTRAETSSTPFAEYGEVRPAGHAFVQDVHTYERVETRRTTTTTRRVYEQYEAPLEGYDVEAGFRLPLPEDWGETRILLGYQDFDNPFGQRFDGMKARLEFRALRALTLDAEWFDHAELNGGDFVVGLRVHLPFDPALLADGKNPFRPDAPARTSSLDDRMADMVVRDVRVRSHVSDPTENPALGSRSSRSSRSTTTRNESTETVDVLGDVQFVDKDNEGDPAMNGTFEHPRDVIQDGVDHTAGDKNVYVFDSAKDYAESVKLADGVQLYGSGTPIVGLGGKQYAATTHPRVVGPGDLPVIQLAENTKVSGLHVSNPPAMKSEAFSSIQAQSPNGNGFWGVTRAGLVGINVSNITLENNIIEQVERGAVLVDTLSSPGDRYQVTLSRNRFQGITPGEAVVIDAKGASGSAAVTLHQNQYLDGDTGLFLDLQGYQSAQVQVTGDQALRNVDGMDLNIEAISGQTALSLDQVTARDNSGKGVNIRKVNGDGGAGLFIDGMDASYNGLNGLWLRSKAVEAVSGDATLDIRNSTFSHNTGSGIEMGGYVQAETGTARVVLSGLTADHNTKHGIRSSGILSVSRKQGDAYLTLSGINTHHNGNSGVEFNDVMAETYHNTGMVVTRVEDLYSTHNGSHGFAAYGEGAYPGAGAGGAGYYTIRNVTVNHNGGRGWYQNDQGVQSGQDAVFVLEGLTALYNGGAGFQMTAFAESKYANAMATVSDLTASHNGSDGAYVQYGAWAPEGRAEVTMNRLTVESNNGDGWFSNGPANRSAFAGSSNGTARVAINGIVSSDNAGGIYFGDDGASVLKQGDAYFALENAQLNDGGRGLFINGRAAYTVQGNATGILRNITANDNQDPGIQLDGGELAYSVKGNATALLEGLTTLNNRNLGIEVGGAGSLAQNGTASTTVKGVTSRFNRDEGLAFSGAIAQSGAGQALTVFDAFNLSDNGGIGLDAVTFARSFNGGASAVLTGANVLRNKASGIDLSQDGASSVNGDAEVVISGFLNNNTLYGLFIGDRLTEITGTGNSTTDLSGLNATGNGTADIFITTP